MATNPVTFDPVVEYDSEVVYMPHWKEYSGTGIKNSADAPFPKPIVEPISLGIVHVWQWEDDFNGGILKARLNKVNSGGWHGWGQDEAWIARITARKINENENDLWHVHYIVKCNEQGWRTNIPQMGYFYKDGADKNAFKTQDGFQYIGFLSEGGGESSSPVPTHFQIKGRTSFSFIRMA